MNKTTSLSLSKALHEKAKEKNYKLPNAERSWINEEDCADPHYEIRDMKYEGGFAHIYGYPAYDIRELFGILDAFKYHVLNNKNEKRIDIELYDYPFVNFDGRTECGEVLEEILGSAVLFLLDNDLIK